MRTPVFTGSCCALATPFDQNGNINYDAFGRLIDAQIAAGVAVTMASDEVQQKIMAATEQASARKREMPDKVHSRQRKQKARRTCIKKSRNR